MKNPALVLGAGFLFLSAAPFACAQTPARGEAKPPIAKPPIQSQPDVPPQTLERNESERDLFDFLNQERTDNGLPELRWDDALFKAARQHALLMMNLNMMEHQLPGEPGLEERLTAAGARFSFIAENIAVGGSPGTIHDGWMNSPGHRKNILEPRVTAVGIAAVRGNNGLFAVEDFSRAYVKLTLEQQEKLVGALLAAKGFFVDRSADMARKACDGTPGTVFVQSYSLMRFAAPDLNELPPEVEKKLHEEARRNVAVGACPTSEEAGFVRYRVALLFY
jgi:uncharacterized protein YkwD